MCGGDHDGRARRAKARLQLQSEERVGKFGLGVRLAHGTVVTFALQVIEFQPRPLGDRAAYHHDARSQLLLYMRVKKRGQGKGAEKVGRKLSFETIDREFTPGD